MVTPCFNCNCFKSSGKVSSKSRAGSKHCFKLKTLRAGVELFGRVSDDERRDMTDVLTAVSEFEDCPFVSEGAPHRRFLRQFMLTMHTKCRCCLSCNQMHQYIYRNLSEVVLRSSFRVFLLRQAHTMKAFHIQFNYRMVHSPPGLLVHKTVRKHLVPLPTLYSIATRNIANSYKWYARIVDCLLFKLPITARNVLCGNVHDELMHFREKEVYRFIGRV
jgi:hypothetical protein